MPVTLHYSDGKSLLAEHTTRFDTLQELKDFINNKYDGGTDGDPEYPFLAHDPIAVCAAWMKNNK